MFDNCTVIICLDYLCSLMEGLLFKWTNYINGWQQRYFSLQDGILSYFASESDIDTGCKGALRVSACDVVGMINTYVYFFTFY